MPTIRLIKPLDAEEWYRLRCLLWPEDEIGEHKGDITEYFAKSAPNLVTFVMDCGDRLGGFVEAGTRAYAADCDSSPVAYLEGWYIEPELRRQGWGAKLVAAVEQWAIEEGLSEIASDCLIDNDTSYQAHLALGYRETERVICFQKALF